MKDKFNLNNSDLKEKVEVQKSDSKWSLDIDIFSKFWGLYIMKLPIPKDVWDYVSEHQHLMPTKELHHATTILDGSPDQMDTSLRQIIFMEII